MSNDLFTRICDLVGEHTAETLIDRLGGAPVYVPECPSANSPLVLAIGHGPASRLCDAFPGSQINLPSRNSIAIRQRREGILFDLRRGVAVNEIARRSGLSSRQILRIKAEAI